MKKKRKEKKDIWIYLITLLVLFSIYPLIRYRIIFNGELSTNHNEWAEFGSFFGGVVTPVLTFATIILLIYTLRHNNQLFTKDIKIKKYEEIYSYLLELQDYSEFLLSSFQMNTKYSVFVTEFQYYKSREAEQVIRSKRFNEIIKPFLTLIELYFPSELKIKVKSFVLYLQNITMNLETQNFEEFSKAILYDPNLLLDKNKFISYIINIKSYISNQYAGILGEKINENDEDFIVEYKKMIKDARFLADDKSELKKIIPSIDYKNRMRSIIHPDGHASRDRFVIDGCITRTDNSILLYSVVSVLEENDTIRYFMNPIDVCKDIKSGTPVYIYYDNQFIVVKLNSANNILYFQIDEGDKEITEVIGKSVISDEAFHTSYSYAG